jgi:hypothetical protein
MRMRVLLRMLLLAAIVAGCSSSTKLSADMSGGSERSGGAVSPGSGGSWSAGSSAMGGESGSGGQIAINVDASAGRGDAGQVSPTLSGDAPVVNWDSRTCTGCNDSGGADGGSSGTSGGSGGSGNSGGRSAGSGGSGSGGSSIAASGGASEAGGRTSGGGVPGTGGRASTGVGGARGNGGATGSGRGGATGVAGSGGGPDGSPNGKDGGISDTGAPAADGGGDSSWAPCVTQIRGVVPATSNLEAYPLVAGDTMRVVLRAEILSGGPTVPVWDWQASRDGVTVPAVAVGREDPAAVVFPIATKGDYTFSATARSSLCSARVSVFVQPVDFCEACDRSVIVRAAPPPDAEIPVQTGPTGLDGSPPFSQRNIFLAHGLGVLVAPSVDGEKVPSYVRISDPAGQLVVDGLAAPNVGFGARLLEMNLKRELIAYDLLVVPIDGPGDDVVAATAPQLFKSRTAAQIKASSFSLSGGVTVTGKTTSTNGQAVPDARVILTNRDPSESASREDLIFSSIGRADANGNYTLHGQPPGPYWVSISPPNGSGLPEALAPIPVNLAADSVISFAWAAREQAGLTLNVYDANGAWLANARVRLTSSQASKVGTLTVNGAGTQDAVGNVRIEGTTSSSGTIVFANLPVGATYNVLIVPAEFTASAATTTYSVTVPAGGAAYDVPAARQRAIFGQLISGASGAAPDWSRVSIVAYDSSSDTPEPPKTVSVNPGDGSYAIGVSPGRSYVVLAVPEAGSGLARTFVGPGKLEGSEFVLPQKVQASMPWSAMVMDEYQRVLPGTALQVFCQATWARCIDPTVPLAETTADAGGVFHLDLPDPATR